MRRPNPADGHQPDGPIPVCMRDQEAAIATAGRDVSADCLEDPEYEFPAHRAAVCVHGLQRNARAHRGKLEDVTFWRKCNFHIRTLL